MGTTVFRDVLVYLAEAPEGCIGPTDVRVDDGLIGAVGGDAGRGAPPEARTIEGGGHHLLLPGLINAHFHSPANHLKGAFASLPLELFMLFESPSGEWAPADAARGLRAHDARRAGDAARGDDGGAGRRVPDAPPRPRDRSTR